jgi:hypothetical protein
VNEKLIRRFTGRYDGIIKIRGGERKITFSNKEHSASTVVKAADRLEICVDVANSVVNAETKCQNMEGSEDRLKSYNGINLFLFLMTNLLMLLAVLRILAIYDIA